MSPERRYSEKEIAAIFKKAASDLESAAATGNSSSGLTLEEMKEIGGDVGIPAQFIERAAASYGHTITEHPTRKVLGVPVDVGRSVDLPGDFTEDDWHSLVSDLNDTFHAQGSIKTEGPLRRWWVGNLQVLVQPSGDGHRLRLQSMNENKRAMLGMSAVVFGMSIFFAIIMAAKGDITDLPEMSFVLSFALLGLGLFGFPAVQLPKWKKLRAEQMEGIATRALDRATKANQSGLPGSSDKIPGTATPAIDLEATGGYAAETNRSGERKKESS